MNTQDTSSLIRICIITPIISKGFRDDAPLRAAVPEGCTISQRFLDRGPASVELAVDEVLAGPGVVDAALAAEAEGAQALVIDCMLDPGLDAAREAVGIPSSAVASRPFAMPLHSAPSPSLPSWNARRAPSGTWHGFTAWATA